MGLAARYFPDGVWKSFVGEILGVLENIGPRESIILARLKGGPLENTGVMQGMSGSPVYIDGRPGALPLGFLLAKEPIAGICPIEEMLRGWIRNQTQIELLRAASSSGDGW